MDRLGADDLCSRINERLGSVPFSYTPGGSEHVLSVAEGPAIRFPQDAGGGVHGGSAAWVAMKHENGAIHEPGLVAALLVLAESGAPVRTILDIGALYGYVSLVARSLFPSAEVHAFEVNPRSYDALTRNIEANRPTFGDSVRAHHCALSDVSRPHAPLRIHRMSIDTLDAGPPVDGKGRDYEIDVWSLDDYCREHALVPDLVKLDVEGYQAKIVPGGREVLSRTRPVILMEFDAPGAANDFGVTNREVIEPLLDDGYRLVWGRHRRTDQPFQVLGLDDLTAEHEVNSLGVLVP